MTTVIFVYFDRDYSTMNNPLRSPSGSELHRKLCQLKYNEAKVIMGCNHDSVHYQNKHGEINLNTIRLVNTITKKPNLIKTWLAILTSINLIDVTSNTRSPWQNNRGCKTWSM